MMRVIHHTYRVLQMAAAVGHNHGGTLWGALTDGADRWRFYRMERAVEYPCDEVRARTREALVSVPCRLRHRPMLCPACVCAYVGSV